MREPKKLLVIGDVHGNVKWMHDVCGKAVSKGCDTIMQLGDFGFWPRHPKGKAFIPAVEKFLTHYGLQLLFIPGNHEDHEELNGYDTHDGFSEIAKNLWYAGRANGWIWNDIRFISLGGAFSIDRGTRILGSGVTYGWFQEELTSSADVFNALSHAPADVMFSHDAPYGIPQLETMLSAYGNYPISTGNRKAIRTVVDEAAPMLLVHGHLHHRYRAGLDGWTTVEGLNCDQAMWHDMPKDMRQKGYDDNMLVLDLDKLKRKVALRKMVRDGEELGFDY